jgi:sulfatase maturation enzyme AslB (radical SAM superfamily)
MRIFTHFKTLLKKFSIYYNIPLLFKVGLPAYVKFWLRSDGFVHPTVVNVELTNHCNLRCKMCVQSAEFLRTKGYMTLDTFKALVAGLAPESSLFISGVGEPMLHPQFFEFLEYALAAKPGLRLGFTTNGTLVTGENAKRLFGLGIKYIQLSMDGVDGVYEAIRGYPYKEIEKRINHLVDAKRASGSSTKILLNVAICNDEVYAQMPEMKKRFGSKVDVIHFMPVHSLGMVKGFKKKNTRCLQIYFSPMISWDGSINACCSDRENTFPLGNCNSVGISEAFNGPEMVKLRRSFKCGELHPVCQACGEIVFGKMGKLFN